MNDEVTDGSGNAASTEDESNASPVADDLGQAMVQLDENIRAVLEYHFIYGHSLKYAYELAGIGDTYDNRYAYRIKNTKFARIYIEHLKKRQLVYREFGVDVPKAVELLELRNKAREANEVGAAIRAHEMILKLIGDLGPSSGGKRGGKGSGGEGGEGSGKGVDRSNKAAIIARLNQLQEKTTGESADIPSSYDISSVDELSEFVEENRAAPSKKTRKKRAKESEDKSDESVE